jgi:hypothetical protein
MNHDPTPNGQAALEIWRSYLEQGHRPADGPTDLHLHQHHHAAPMPPPVPVVPPSPVPTGGLPHPLVTAAYLLLLWCLRN